MILRLMPEDRELFAWLDPFGFLERAMLPDHFALAATIHSKQKEVPAGILVGSVSAERILIEWLCVAPKGRKRGVGDGLVTAVLEMARKHGIPEAGALFLEKKGMEKFVAEGMDYFAWQGFLTERRLFGEWNLTLSDVRNSQLFLSETGAPLKAKTLGEVGKAKANVAIQKLGRHPDASTLFNLKAIQGRFDEQLSSVIFEKDKPKGLLLVQKIDDACYPVALYAKSFPVIKTLVTRSVMECEQIMPRMAEIRVIVTDRKVADMLEGVFPEEGIPSRILIRS